MPAMDGYEVAKSLRRRRRVPEVVVIALTGFVEATDKSQALEAGIDHYLVKPVDPLELEHLIESVISLGGLPADPRRAKGHLGNGKNASE
jgi:CheY-like chemotaxis protein